MFRRHLENKIKKLLSYFPVIGIIGPRQVGKTTLAKMLQQEIGKESIYLDLENPRDIAKLDDPVLYFEDNMDKCILLDEVQNMPEIFPILRSMIDENRVPARFILLGSASPDLIRNSSETLAGRIAYTELTPLNIIEVNTIDNSQETLWLQGGFPNAFTMSDAELVNNWHYNYIKTYVERDLPAFGLNINRRLLNQLFVMLSHIHGDMINYNMLSKSLDLSSKTLKRYISVFEGAFLIRQLTPFHANIKKRLVKAPKIYIRDSGILHYLQNISDKDDLYGNPLLGNSWEGFVVEQIIQLLPQKYQCYFYRTHDGAECDLVIAKSHKPIMAIEIKYSSSPKISRGTTIAFDDLNTSQNFVVTPNSDDYPIRDHVRVCSLTDFLNSYLSNLK